MTNFPGSGSETENVAYINALKFKVLVKGIVAISLVGLTGFLCWFFNSMHPLWLLGLILCI